MLNAKSAIYTEFAHLSDAMLLSDGPRITDWASAARGGECGAGLVNVLGPLSTIMLLAVELYLNVPLLTIVLGKPLANVPTPPDRAANTSYRSPGNRLPMVEVPSVVPVKADVLEREVTANLNPYDRTPRGRQTDVPYKISYLL